MTSTQSTPPSVDHDHDHDQYHYGDLIPSWFAGLAHGPTNNAPTSEALGQRSEVAVKALDNMYVARAAFKDDAHHATLVLMSLLAGVCYALKSASDGKCAERLIWAALAVVGSVSVNKLCATYGGKLYAGYRLYVAACIQAAMASYAAGFSFTHEWFRDIAKRCNESGWFYETVQLQPGGWRATVFREESKRALQEKDHGGWICQNETESSRKPKNISELASVWMAASGNLWLLHRRTLQHVAMIQRFLLAGSLSMLSFSLCNHINGGENLRWFFAAATVVLCGYYFVFPWYGPGGRRSFDYIVEHSEKRKA